MVQALSRHQPYEQALGNFMDAAEILLRHGPDVAAVVGGREELEASHGWRAFRSRVEAWRQRGGKPMVVSVLYGSSGAGKSTFFNLLTQCSVPAAGYPRPLTSVGCVAVPGKDIGAKDLRQLFVGFDVQPLKDVEQLRQEDQPDDRVYWTSYVDKGLGLPVVLADLPDFNSVERKNWEKASRILARAEVVVFFMSAENYSDARVVENLALCCRSAAHLVLLYTKIHGGEPHARTIHQDLLGRHVERATHFQDTRHDGQTLGEFVRQAPAYYSPLSMGDVGPTLDGVVGVESSQPQFSAMFAGLDQAEILRASLFAPGAAAARQMQKITSDVENQGVKRQQDVSLARNITSEAVIKLATRALPLKAFLEIAVDECRSRQPVWVRPVSRLAALNTKGFRAAKQFLKGRGADDTLKAEHEQVEREQLLQAADAIYEELRVTFPGEVKPQGLLAEERFAELRAKIESQPLPAADQEWRTVAREETKIWCQQNPGKSKYVPATLDVVLASGVVVLMLDATFIGGAGNFTIASVVGGAGGGASLVTRILAQLGLEMVFQRAANRWHLRQSEIFEEFLWKQLVKPLCAGKWEHAVEQAQSKAVQEVHKASAMLLQSIDDPRSMPQ